jgi:hypothetical protein
MAKQSPKRAPALVKQSAENRQSAETGTARAIYSPTPSCGLLSADTVPVKTWGGARNRADRVSEHLTARQRAGLISAAAFAEHIGLAFNRHWTLHYERAGIAEHDGARFIGHMLRLASAYARRHGGELAAIWVRENGEGKGGHVHILLHLSAGLTLMNRTRRWIVKAGGTYRRNVSRVRPIGRSLRLDPLSHDYRVNADVVLAYVLKITGRCPEPAVVIGKRCGRTENIGSRLTHGVDSRHVS